MACKNINILLLQQLAWGIRIGHKIAKILNTDGYRLSAFVHGKQTKKFLQNQTKVQYQHMFYVDPLYDKGDDIVTSQQVQEIEERYNLDSIWRTIYSDRFLVYTFLNSRHFKTQKPVSNNYILSVCWNMYRFIQDVIDKTQPAYVVGAVIGCLPNYLLYLECKHRNIPFFTIGPGRINNYHYIADGLCLSSKIIQRRHEELLINPEISTKYEKAKCLYSEMRRDNPQTKPAYLRYHRREKPFASTRWFFEACLSILLFPAKIAKAILLHKQVFGMRHIWNPANSRLNAVLNVYIGLREKFLATDNQGKCIQSVDEINFRYVFFPLHLEPELSLMVFCPEYSNQLEICRRISLNLPKGVRLLVKEHPNMVRARKKQFYEDLKGLPNVEMLHSSVSSERIFMSKQCVAVISISSTAALEAAMNGKPVVVLTPEFERLPTVHYASTLSKAIKQICVFCSEDLAFDAAEIERGNLAYLCAMLENSFATDYSKHWTTQKGDIDAKKTVQAIYRWLEEKSGYQPTT